MTEFAEAANPDYGGGIDTVIADVSFTLSANVENLTLTGSAAIDGTGNGQNNVIRGNSGANVLTGGGGNDTYYIQAGDTVTELVGEGIDKVSIGISYTLGANLEHLTLTGSARTGNGNGLNNTIVGNSLNNDLNGLAGSDRMAGGPGSDTYWVDNSGDTVVELPKRRYRQGQSARQLHARRQRRDAGAHRRKAAERHGQCTPQYHFRQ